MRSTPFQNFAFLCREGTLSFADMVARGMRLLDSEGFPKSLLTNGETNTKVRKGISGDTITVRAFLLTLVPSTFLGKLFNFCAFASLGCSLACLFTAGRGIMRNVSAGRIRKAVYFAVYRPRFLAMLAREIQNKITLGKRIGAFVAFRLNVVSDVAWESHPRIRALMEGADPSAVVWYDYTKVPKRYARFLEGVFPATYHLTFSLSETNRETARGFLARGGSVAVCFDCQNPDDFPKQFMGFDCINGEVSDYRFLDPVNVIVCLTAKGMAKRDREGFAVSLTDPEAVYNVANRRAPNAFSREVLYNLQAS